MLVFVSCPYGIRRQNYSLSSVEDAKAIISFVGWGGLNEREGKLGETATKERESQMLEGENASIAGVDDSADDEGNPGEGDGVTGLEVETDAIH